MTVLRGKRAANHAFGHICEWSDVLIPSPSFYILNGVSVRLLTLSAFPIAALVSGCVSTAHRPPMLSFDEAFAFEKALQKRQVSVPERPVSHLYTQPVNKKEPCKLPTTEAQQDRPNFRAYWDGQCKNGYAFGLGRDIAISDTHHVEEITIYKDKGDSMESPAALYDFVNNTVQYTGGFAPYPKAVTYGEMLTTNSNGFFVRYRVTATDDLGLQTGVESSPLNPSRVYFKDERNVVYRFIDNSAFPYLEPNQAKLSAEIFDPQTQKAGGVAVFVAGNGQARYFRRTDTGSAEQVSLPPEYIKHLEGKLAAAKAAEQTVNQGLEAARRMEREYLYMACNGKYKIDGLDKDIATKICNWREQFRPAFEQAAEKAKQQMDELKRKGEAAQQATQRQQRITQEEQRMQQQELQQMANGFAQIGQQMNAAGQQTLQNVTSMPAPQVWTPQGSSQVRCVNAGVVTNCRY